MTRARVDRGRLVMPGNVLLKEIMQKTFWAFEGLFQLKSFLASQGKEFSLSWASILNNRLIREHTRQFVEFNAVSKSCIGRNAIVIADQVNVRK